MWCRSRQAGGKKAGDRRQSEGYTQRKDAFDAQRGAEEQRQRETTRLVRAPQHLAQRAFGDAAQGERGGQEEEGAPEMGAPKDKGRAPSASPADSRA